VDRVDVGVERELNDLRDPQVGIDWALAPPHQVRFVRFVAVQVQAIFMAEDRDRANVEFGRGPEYADRYLPPVGTQDLLDGARRRGVGHDRAEQIVSIMVG